MDEVAILSGTEPRKMLQTVIEKKVPATMSYLSKGKLCTAKGLLTNLGANRLDIQLSTGKRAPISQKARKKDTKKPNLIDIQVNQTVGISLKYGYAKFIFETTVVDFEPLAGPTIAIMVPDRIEIVQRRNFFRVDVPDSLKVNVMMWHRCPKNKRPEAQRREPQTSDDYKMPPEHYWKGELVDISAGGVQIVVDTNQKPDFKKGQFLSLRFTPIPYEAPLMLDARVRNILQTADEKSVCLGLQIVDLKTSPQGRQILQRLCNVAEHYHQINQYSTKHQDFQATT